MAYHSGGQGQSWGGGSGAGWGSSNQYQAQSGYGGKGGKGAGGQQSWGQQSWSQPQSSPAQSWSQPSGQQSWGQQSQQSWSQPSAQQSWNQPASQSWNQPAAQSWNQAPAAQSWNQQASTGYGQSPYAKPAAKPMANPWGQPMAKPQAPAAGPWSAQQGASWSPYAAKPAAAAAPYGRPGYPTPGPKPAAPWGVQIAKPVAKPMARPGMLGKSPLEILRAQALAKASAAKPAAIAKPSAVADHAKKLQEQRAAMADRAIRAAAAKQALELAAKRKAGADGAAPADAAAGAKSDGLTALAAAPVVRPATARPAWMEQLNKVVLAPWDTVERCVLDLAKRFPTLELHKDLQHVTCHWAEEGWRGRIPLHPLKETLAVDPEKDQVVPKEDEDKEKAAEPPASGIRRVVRVALLTGKMLNVPMHMAGRIQFLLHKAAKEPAVLPGGEWDAKKDGAGPDKVATLKKTAVRILKDSYGLDLSKATFHRFMDLKFTGEDGVQTHTTILLPEVWEVTGDSPLQLGRIVNEVEQEFVKVVEEEEPLPEEEIAAARKKWEERIATQRADAQKPRPNEREADRIERLERLEETLKDLEKRGPDAKTTRTVKKEVREKKLVKVEVSRPTFLGLSTMRDLSQMMKKGDSVLPTFETKLFAMCFDEMVRLESGLQIVDWMQDYKVRAKAESELRTAKHKREFDQIQEHNKINKERRAKRQKLEVIKKVEEVKKAKADAKKAKLREADRLEQELLEKEKAKESAEASGDGEAATEEMEPDLPPLKLSKLVFELKEEDMRPFLYFDSSAQGTAGSMSRADLLQVFHRTAARPQAEIQELVKATLIDTPAAKAAGGMWSYKGACSVQTEVLPEEGAEDAAENGEKPEAAEDEPN